MSCFFASAAAKLILVGRDLDRRVLADGQRAHAEYRVVVFGQRKVVFGR